MFGASYNTGMSSDRRLAAARAQALEDRNRLVEAAFEATSGRVTVVAAIS